MGRNSFSLLSRIESKIENRIDRYARAAIELDETTGCELGDWVLTQTSGLQVLVTNHQRRPRHTDEAAVISFLNNACF